MIAEGASWERDLAWGEELEQRVIKLFAPKHTLVKAEGNHPDWDLQCSECGITIECKRDKVAETTGNFCFETKLLRTSLADYLIYEAGTLYWCELEDARYWISLAIELGWYTEREVGENRTMGYIVPIEDSSAYMKEW